MSGTCYSAAYMNQTQDQQRFTISEVAADWHELMIPRHIMRLSIVRASEQLDRLCCVHTYHRLNQPHKPVSYYSLRLPTQGWPD